MACYEATVRVVQRLYRGSAMSKMKRKARVVSPDRLSAAIDEAIAGAAQRRHVGIRRSTLSGPGRITGRLILEPDMTKALEV